MYDLIIKGGTIVDVISNKRFTGDNTIDYDLIAAVGKVADTAKETNPVPAKDLVSSTILASPTVCKNAEYYSPATLVVRSGGGCRPCVQSPRFYGVSLSFPRFRDPDFALVLGKFSIPGNPLRYSAFPEPLPLEAPFLGEHNKEGLTEILSYSDQELAALESEGIIRQRAY